MFLKLRNTSENWGWGAEEITEEVILGSHKFRKLWFKQFSNGDVDVVNMRGSVPCAVFRLMNRFTFMAGFFCFCERLHHGRHVGSSSLSGVSN